MANGLAIVLLKFRHDFLPPDGRRLADRAVRRRLALSQPPDAIAANEAARTGWLVERPCPAMKFVGNRARAGQMTVMVRVV
jgi:hypothetical protein